MPLIRLASDVTVGEAFADITGLSFAVAASTNYYFRFVTHFITDATTTGARFGVNGPASPTALRVGGFLGSGTGAMSSGSQNAYDTAILATTTGPGTTPTLGVIEGILRNGSNAGTLVLRGQAENVTPDGTVTVQAGSTGLLQPVSAVTRVTADRTVTGTAFADVTDLTFAVSASTNYYFRFVVHYTTNATTTGARFGINGPASQTAVRIGGLLPTGTANSNFGSQNAYNTAIFAATTGPGATAVTGIIEGVFRNGTNSGTLALRFAAEVVSPGSVTVLTDSFGVLATI